MRRSFWHEAVKLQEVELRQSFGVRLELRSFKLELRKLYVWYMGGCQNDGPFLGPYCNTSPRIQGTQGGP